ncbi:MAG: type IV pilus modification PilV family protein [Planctomycetota bacterium]|jgi:prepilin-type N-terminal cleavage/methylation domain-containing protein
MSITRKKHSNGFSLVEVMIAILILSVAVIGASGYRYYAALDARKADMQMTASRVALMLCESWRGLNGDQNYDPTNYFGSELQLVAIEDHYGTTSPGGFNMLGRYQATLNNLPCYITMSWADVASGLRALNVVVDWSQQTDPDNQSVIMYGGDSLNKKTFKLTTYTQT